MFEHFPNGLVQLAALFKPFLSHQLVAFEFRKTLLVSKDDARNPGFNDPIKELF